VIVVGGLGLFAAGKDRRTAGIVDDIYHHTISVLGAATTFGGYVSLSARDAFDVEYWPLELYKLSLAPSEKELARRIALVTGGASGIGRAAAQRLAAEGAHVVLGDLDAAGARKAAEEIVGAVGAGRAIGLGMDVTSEISVRSAFEEAVLAYGGVDIVVSNAGTAHSSPVDRMELADWERSFAVNATGHFLVAREVTPRMLAAGSGRIVNISVSDSTMYRAGFVPYGPSRAGSEALSRIMAADLRDTGITVNLLLPGGATVTRRSWIGAAWSSSRRSGRSSHTTLRKTWRKRRRGSSSAAGSRRRTGSPPGSSARR
jgi:NAD(P)-dependent dehydrogenase (short-subunit alcohol dehydrogenase family)